MTNERLDMFRFHVIFAFQPNYLVSLTNSFSSGDAISSGQVDGDIGDGHEDYLRVKGKQTSLHLAHKQMWAQFKEVCDDRQFLRFLS